MIVAGYILLGISIFIMIIVAASNLAYSTIVAVAIIACIAVYFAIPGIVLLSVGYSLKRRRENKPKLTNKVTEDIYVCSECGYQVYPDFKCCPKCGSELNFEQDKGKFCGTCGKELTEEHVFCPYCGTKR